MERIIIRECHSLKGRVRVSGSKNSALPIIAASLLSRGECVIKDIPPLSDVEAMREMIIACGGKADYDKVSETLNIFTPKIDSSEIPFELAGKMRASFLAMGPLLAGTGRARLPLPGGCAIGARPIELHLKGMKALGAEITTDKGYVEAKAKKLRGANIYLDFPSVGATENLIMAAALAEGHTVISNCAAEPEIVDLANFLNMLGADIKGAGTDSVKINGVKELRGGEYTVIPDRIEAGTFMIAAALTHGDVVIDNVVCDHLRPITAKLKEAGAVIEENGCSMRVRSTGRLNPVDIKTLPYPGFPTDLQAQLMGLLSVAEGSSVVTETIFENRFMHAGELKRMGADIKIEGRVAVINGVKKLNGARVKATDLRAGACLILAGLRASGETEISDIHHIERGYFSLDEKLRGLGANIYRAN